MDKIFKLSKKEQVVVQFIMIAWALVVLVPFLSAVLNALKPNVGAVFRDPFGFPDPITWGNFAKAWVNANFGRYFANSAFIALSSVAIVTFASSTTAFVLARMPFKGSTLIFICFMIGVIIPIRLALAPLFDTVRTLGLLDSLWSVIFVQAASMMPVAVFILVSFFQNISKEIEEAAIMDGAMPFTIYWKIMVPLIRPALATIALLTFVQAWNEYFLPLIFIQSEELYPLTLGLNQFNRQFAIQWHMMFAAILIMMAPTIIAFVLASKQFISGLTQGGVKE
ncbi:carbohydrate ABC transporter permease [Reinekea blandensis]|uniref:ABC transporter permease n=1 Tax=Reinekea blandensis MED297 TaxID=314283 RepID=A4BJS9_9GAMM|nr:carbohydrate ABC transporter permease [Reinekea blandensis]EAR07596.1 ABC transporter permease [Reinekea sp. MED297] [Reinekea blandensis MED297]